MRISDRDRAQAIQALGEHYALSRLSLAEYEDRVDRVTRSITGNDLMTVFIDLPAPGPMGDVALYPQAQMSQEPMGSAPYGMP